MVGWRLKDEGGGGRLGEREMGGWRWGRGWGWEEREMGGWGSVRLEGWGANFSVSAAASLARA